ncbi:MAG: signal recognition particle protein [Firmicutes bacterium]|nr:signal recognition particle protein [Bacillota bacterium]
MIFEGLSSRLQETFKRLKGRGKLTEKDVKAALREVKLALLEADVNYKVVRDFVKKVQERAVGAEVMESLTPGQHVVKIVRDELTELMGGKAVQLRFESSPPHILMLCGLQGSGKTTTAGKLAKHLQKQGRRPLLVACDIYRPAAIKQLQVVGEKVGIPVFTLGEEDPVVIAKAAKEHALENNNDVIILDTAGRLHIDTELMAELQAIKEAVKVEYTVLVVDAMTGQDAVTVAEEFDQALNIDGVILTKLDGDARGGAALSVRAVTGKPILFGGFGEKTEALEVFHPDRMASRILGMGDVLTLIEKAEANLDQQRAEEMGKRILTAEFTLEDFLEYMAQMRKMGPLDEILQMLPGANKIRGLKNIKVDEKQLKRIEAIIQSMTLEERRRPEIIDGSRRRRIAAGAGVKVQDVNKLLKQFNESKKLMKQLGLLEKKAKKSGFFSLFK